MGEIPNFSEDEPSLSARIRASFLTKLFRHADLSAPNSEFLGVRGCRRPILASMNLSSGWCTVCAPCTRR